MRISIQDGSDYFRGLLLLLRMDRTVSAGEVALMRRIGSSLGFEPGFCETAIRDILDNQHVPEGAPLFSTPALAEMFLRDGLTIAHADGSVHPSEVAWLRQVAERNGLGAEWLDTERARIAEHPQPLTALEADGLSVRYS